MSKFNVLSFNFNKGKIEPYDVIPYFKRIWEAMNTPDKNNLINKEKFKEWVIFEAKYQFWSRCQYEMVVGAWPFGSYKMNERIKELKKNDEDTYDNLVDAALSEMAKIDIYEQLMMNIDILVEILIDEFSLDFTKK